MPAHPLESNLNRIVIVLLLLCISCNFRFYPDETSVVGVYQDATFSSRLELRDDSTFALYGTGEPFIKFNDTGTLSGNWHLDHKEVVLNSDVKPTYNPYDIYEYFDPELPSDSIKMLIYYVMPRDVSKTDWDTFSSRIGLISRVEINNEGSLYFHDGDYNVTIPRRGTKSLLFRGVVCDAPIYFLKSKKVNLLKVYENPFVEDTGLCLMTYDYFDNEKLKVKKGNLILDGYRRFIRLQ